MRLRLAVLVLALSLNLLAQPFGASTVAAAANQKKSGPKQNAVPKSSSMTGCVDEKAEEGYVLVEDQTLRITAVLQAEGFPQEGLAKYLGNKVTVQGRTVTDGGRTVMKVQRIEKIADGCNPAR